MAKVLMNADLEILDHVPSKGGIRKTAIKDMGGKELFNLYDSRRFDCGVRSRRAAHACKKDSKAFRSWQRDRRSIKEFLESFE